MWDLIVSVSDHCLSFYIDVTQRDVAQMTSTKVTFYDVNSCNSYRALRKETERLEKLNSTTECIVITTIS